MDEEFPNLVRGKMLLFQNLGEVAFLAVFHYYVEGVILGERVVVFYYVGAVERG